MRIMQAVKTDSGRWFCAWPAICAAALATGCAGGAWLESPLQAELPIDPPKNAYPTALPSASTAAPATPASLTSATVVPADPHAAANYVAPAPADANHAAANNQQRLDRPQPLRTNLVVIPPQYLHGPPSSPAAANTPNSQPAAATTPAPTPNSTHTASTAHSTPSSIPQLDLSFLDALASSQATHSSTSSPPTASADTAAKNGVQLASHESSETQPSAPERLEKAHAALIEALEAEIRRRRDANSNDEELPRLEQQLRLVYAAAGRMDDAVAVVESLDASQREAYKHLMFGLGVWLSPDEARRSALRTAKVLHSLRDATTDLTAASKLELKNLAFCERVDQFGWYTEFPRKEFQPKQQVILYAEVENFAAEHKGASNYETELQGSYVILDSTGQEIASRQLQLDKEVCRNYRRDYFLAYRIYLPDNIEPGRYRLELTVEDLKARGKYQGRKLGDGVIEFTIR